MVNKIPMSTSQQKLIKVIVPYLKSCYPDGRTLKQIYAEVEQQITFVGNDIKATIDYNKQPRWKRNTKNALHELRL